MPTIAVVDGVKIQMFYDDHTRLISIRSSAVGKS